MQTAQNTSSPFAALDSLQIETQIRELANLGVANIENDAQSVYTATNGIDTALGTSDSAVSIGNQAVTVGNELFQFSNNTMDTIASYAVSSGNNAINTAQSGRTIFNDTASENTANEDRVDEARNSVSRGAGALGVLTGRVEEEENPEDIAQDATDNAIRDNRPVDETAQEATDQFERDREANQEQADIDPTLADTSITTDPNEILKRKERRGLT